MGEFIYPCTGIGWKDGSRTLNKEAFTATVWESLAICGKERNSYCYGTRLTAVQFLRISVTRDLVAYDVAGD